MTWYSDGKPIKLSNPYIYVHYDFRQFLFGYEHYPKGLKICIGIFWIVIGWLDRAEGAKEPKRRPNTIPSKRYVFGNLAKWTVCKITIVGKEAKDGKEEPQDN